MQSSYERTGDARGVFEFVGGARSGPAYARERSRMHANHHDPARTRFVRQCVGPWNLFKVEEGMQVTCVDPNEAHVGRSKQRRNARAMGVR